MSTPAIIVANPLPNLDLAANDADVQINVENVFSSEETPPLPITITVEDNSNTALVTANISGNTLTLSLVPDAFGTAIITLRGEDTNSAFANSSFTINVSPPPIDTFPLIVDFEDGGLPLGWEASGALPWIVNSLGIPSGGTGPLGDNTQPDGSGFYIYTEATGPNPGDQGVLLSRDIDLTSLNSPIMNVFYHMFGAGIGSLDVEVVDLTNSSTVTNVFTITGQQQLAADDPYIEAFSIDLSVFSSSVIQLRFVGTRGNAFTSDIAIDDISVSERSGDDLGVTAIEVSGDPFFSNAETVTVTVTNFGTTPQSNFPISYILDGGAQIDETFTETIAGNSTATYSFTTLADLSAAGNHTITALTGLVGDANASNDSFTQDFNTVPIISSFPYVEDLENVTGALPLGWAIDGTVVWALNSGTTPSGGTGPSVDNTIGDATGTYIFSETSGPVEGDEGAFTTGAFDVSGLATPTLEFFYHMFGVGIGSLDVEVMDVTNNTVTNVFTLSGQQQVAQTDPYLQARVDLSPFSSSIIQLRFISTRGVDFTGDIAIDDVSIFNLPDNDLAINNIATPPVTANGRTNEVIIEIINQGALAQSNFNVAYQFPGEAAVVETFTGTIQPGETATFTFAQTFTLTNIIGGYTFDALGDANATNDLQEFTGFSLVAVVNAFPYEESFESGIGGWFPALETGVLNSFELGTPSTTNINGASDGTQAWVTSLTGNYFNNEQSSILAPGFDFTTVDDPAF